MSAVRLAWRLVRAGGTRAATTAALAATGSAVTALVLLLVASTWSGFGERADRVQWRSPAAAVATDGAGGVGAVGGVPGSAVQRTTTTTHAGGSLVVVDLAATDVGTPPVPPGLRAFPAPGEVFVSPALAAVIGAAAPDALAQRFGPVTGELGGQALATPDELVAVVGHEPTDATMTAPAWQDQRRADAYAGPTVIAGFGGRELADSDALEYRVLVQIAAVLLVVPLLVLGAASARLGQARRTARLAALRLSGATPGQVLVMGAVESAAVAAAGAVVGAVAAFALAPVLAAVPVAGGRWYPSDLRPGALPVVAVVLGVVALAVASAASSLRQVLRAPLGVAAATTPRRMSALRVLAFVGVVLVFLHTSRGSDPSVGALVLLLAAVFAGLAVVGPWVVDVLGRVVVHRSRSTASLLAGRRMRDDPRAVWRTVGAVAMTGFVAGALALFPTGSDDVTWGAADRLDVVVPADGSAQVADRLTAALAAGGVGGEVTTTDDAGALLFVRDAGAHRGEGASTTTRLSVVVPGGQDQLDVARAVVARTAPQSVAATGADVIVDESQLAADVRTASALVLGICFLVAAAAVGTTSAATVLDRATSYRRLALMGTPLRVLERARTLETLLPLVVLALGSTVTGVVVTSPLTRLGFGGSSFDLGGLVQVSGCLVLGVVAVAAATLASRPLVVRASTASGPDLG